MIIIINMMNKIISKSQSILFIKSIDAKNMKNDIMILKKQSRTISNANVAQRFTLNQKAMIMRSKRVFISESNIMKIIMNWSVKKENNDFIFIKSNNITQTFIQICYILLDMIMTSKKKKIILIMKFRDSNMTNFII